jgi:uncharacterized protein YdeI (YjbR/CyaY-like superfamily)
MSTTPPRTDARVDTYIAGAPAFAQPILERLRAAVHRACPDAEETMKWSRPHFTLDGHVFAGMSAFKAHCTFGFWDRRNDSVETLPEPAEKAMGQFGRIESVADLPAATALRALIAQAARESRAARAAAATTPPVPRARRAPLAMPEDFAAALRAQRAAGAHFDAFAPGQQRDYIEWITEARREETRASRIAQAIEWIAEGKTRHWKYRNC